MSKIRDKVLIEEFIRTIKDKGYVIASECNDSESDQCLDECYHDDDLVNDFINDMHDADTPPGE